jgi:DNA adenine methylase
MRPFLKWAGGKYTYLEKILPSLLPGQRLIEPFTGSGSIFLNTEYPSYLLAETNQDLISLFITVQEQGEAFINDCQTYFQPELNCAERYYQLREEFNSLCSSEQKSAIFLYLNRHGYNGLCRYNSQGKLNVPFGSYAKPYFPKNEMLYFHQKSQNAQFYLADFRETFKQAQPGDIIYCDPPYVLPLSSKSRLISYNEKTFKEVDQIELAELAKQTAARGIPVIISNHDTEFTRHYYKEALIKNFGVQRSISCLADERGRAQELIAVFTPH